MHLSMFLQKGKLKSRSIDAANSIDSISSRLHVYDKSTKMKFLVDSGADVSVIPPKLNEKRNQSNFKLFAANNAIIKTYGNKQINLDLGLRRNFQWKFIIADVSQPILGADFLRHYSLLIDLKNRRIVDPLTNLKSNCSIANVPTSNLTTVDKTSPFF